MATITIDGAELVVTLERSEKRWGLLSSLRIPVGSISAVEVVLDGRTAVVGVRAPGLGGTQRRIGTWRSTGNKQYVCVRRNQPAVRITLEHQKYRTILVGSDEAERVAGEVRAAAGL